MLDSGKREQELLHIIQNNDNRAGMKKKGKRFFISLNFASDILYVGNPW